MNQSPPKPSPSSRPPAASGSADSGRRITAIAAGGSVLLLSITAVALWPRTYGTEATFKVEGEVPNASALAGRVEATLLEREELARVAIELPPELRSPDPIGRLRAGIRVQSRGPLGYVVEFRGSEPKSVQRITNLLADRAVALVPKLAAAPEDQAAALTLAARTRAVTEFLTAHPEVTLEAPADNKPAKEDSGLEALRTEKRQIEQKLAAAATDNPYSDPDQNPELLSRRLAEIKNTITRREKALKEPKPTSPPAAAADLVAQWRQLLADLAAAQSAASQPAPVAPVVKAHITARATLPDSPITPNRLVLTIVALLLSAAAAMVAYVLPRKQERRQSSKRPPAVPPLAPGIARSEPPRPRTSDAPVPRAEPLALSPAPEAAKPPSDPPPAPRPPSEPPGPIAAQRTVVLGGNGPAPKPVVAPRSHTTPGGLEAPIAQAIETAGTAAPQQTTHTAPPAPLFGSRPPPGAGSYSVSSSHPPPMEGVGSTTRTSVERLSPLQSTRPVAASAPVARRAASPAPQPGSGPQILSLPPALDPDAESWAARFENPPPPEPTRPTHPVPTQEASVEDAPRKRGSRWKTQAMGSMVPLEVMAARDLPPDSESYESYRSSRQAPSPHRSTVVHHDVPLGWTPRVDPKNPDVLKQRDAVLHAATGRRLTLLVTGPGVTERAQFAGALGLAVAEAGARALLVEADFDAPQLHQVMALSTPTGAGFSQQLMARRQARHPEPWVVMRCTSNLQVLAEGRFRSPGLVATREFETALGELGDQYHVIIVHAPALSRAEDLRPLGALAQAAILVAPGRESEIKVAENPLRGLV